MQLDVSNDDLLEAIEQLSMLAKPPNSERFDPITENGNGKLTNDSKSSDQEEKDKYTDFLKDEKKVILEQLESYKKKVEEIETQEEELLQNVS